LILPCLIICYNFETPFNIVTVLMILQNSFSTDGERHYKSNKENNYGVNSRITIELLLRRTIVRSYRYAAMGLILYYF